MYLSRKKVLSLAVSATGAGKLEEISSAFVELVEDFQQKAVTLGTEDPAGVAALQKCEELLPGEVSTCTSTITSTNRVISLITDQSSA